VLSYGGLLLLLLQTPAAANMPAAAQQQHKQQQLLRPLFEDAKVPLRWSTVQRPVSQTHQRILSTAVAAHSSP
jgi:hypothetical protein